MQEAKDNENVPTTQETIKKKRAELLKLKYMSFLFKGVH